MTSSADSGDSQTASSVIQIGNSDSVPYVSVGDESKYGDWLVYAMVYVERKHIDAIAERLRLIKYRFKLPVSEPIHCYALFNKHQRKRRKISHLTDADARFIITLVTTILVQKAFVRSGVARANDMAARLGNSLSLTSAVDGSTKELPVASDYKAHFGQLMLACTFDVTGYDHFPKARDTEIIVSEENTKINFFGSKRRADRLFNNFSEIGAPDGHVFQLNPKVVAANAHPLIELADVAAYIVAHSKDDKPWNATFRNQLQRLSGRYLEAEIPPIPFLAAQSAN